MAIYVFPDFCVHPLASTNLNCHSGVVPAENIEDVHGHIMISYSWEGVKHLQGFQYVWGSMNNS